MSLLEFDLFDFWRYFLTILGAVYALLTTARSTWEWCVYLAGPDRHTAMLRRYVIVQLLTIRVRRFRAELAQIAFWSVALVALLWVHLRIARGS